jgi:hypothetical protein
LASARRAEANTTAARLAQQLAVPVRTLERWRGWWQEQFPLTALWRAAAGRFVPPLAAAALPANLLERFVGAPADRLLRLLWFLTPLSVGRPITFSEDR